jgi:hypothetical protein
MEKKIITIIIIILIFYCISCTTINNSSNINNTSKNNNFHNNTNIEIINDLKIEYKSEFQELVNICHYSGKLKIGDKKTINAWNRNTKLELIDFKENDSKFNHILYNKNKSESWKINNWAKIIINDDKIIQFPVRELVDINFQNGEKISIAVSLIRNDYIIYCIDTNEDFDIEYCNKKIDHEKYLCFRKIGDFYGIQNCSQIKNLNDKKNCEIGANENNI